MDDITARDLIPGLNGEFTLKELIKAYRRQSFVVHPDHGGTAEEFSILQDAFDFLKPQAVHELGKEVYELQTIDGTPLAELGQGLPITVSAKECEFCEGKGYKVFYNYTQDVTCPACEGEGTFWLPCKKCNGTGDYRHPKTNKVIGECNLCGGNGRFYPRFRRQNVDPRDVWSWMIFGRPEFVVLPNGQRRAVNACKECRGHGSVKKERKDKPTYIRCDQCEGTGEIKIYNPVIPRGFLVGVKK